MTEDEAYSEATQKLIDDEIGVRTMSEDRVDEILEAMGGMEVKLSEDPISRGPRFLIRQIAQVRNYMSEAQNYREEVQNHVTRLKRRLNNITSEYEIRYNAIRIEDPDVRDFSAAKDRDAACEHKLAGLKVRMSNLESEISELESVLEAVNNRFSNLRQTSWDIRKQRDLIEDELKITNTDWSQAPMEGMSEDVEEGEVDLDEEALKNGTELDIRREAPDTPEDGESEPGVSDDETPDDGVTMSDLMAGVDSESDRGKIEGPELGSPPEVGEVDSEDEIEPEQVETEDAGASSDSISDALEGLDIDF